MKKELRFEKYNEEWEETTVSKVCNISTGKSNTQDQVKDGLYPFYIRSEQIVRSNKYLYDCEAVITIGDGNIGRVFHYANGKFDLHQRCYIMKDFKDINALYFYYFFSTYFYGRAIRMSAKATVDSVRLEMISEMPLFYPKNEEEQRLIASYFQSLDTLIQATSKQLASLKQIKAASLQSMFPQEGETKPRVRFKGFEGEWKEERLFDLFIERHDISTITDSLPQLSFTISEGVIYPEDRKSNKRDFLIRDIVNKKYLITYVGDIIYNPANVVYGAIHRNSLCNGVVSPIYKIFKTEQDSIFMECIVRNPLFISRLSMKTEGTVTKLKTLKPESFLEMNVMITPSIQEQQKIGSYFLNLDRQITLQTRRLEKLKQIKAACLDKMFV